MGRDRVDTEEEHAPLDAVARGIGLALGTKPNSAEMGIVSTDSATCFGNIPKTSSGLFFTFLGMAARLQQPSKELFQNKFSILV